VGLDVHARSVVGCGIDTVTGEVFRRRLCPAHGEVLGWLGELPGPVAVVYEAGPTGFGLARAVRAAGMRCEVAAPSKLQRLAGDRVKTDEKDSLHMARLLRLGQITSVRVPDEAEEAARDLVRARDDVRGELMRARHRTSKLLLRQGVVYSGGVPGRMRITPGCVSNASRSAACRAPTTRPMRRCCWPRRAATTSTRRSRRWPPIRHGPRW
jgi:transposase